MGVECVNLPDIKVSILVPMKNAQKFIRGTLQSLLSQEAVKIEIIVIDDCSTDDSAAIVSSLADDRVKLIQGPGKGISEALNEGLDNSLGEIIMRCDADDFFTKDRVISQVQWLDANTSYGAVCGGFSTLDEKGNNISELLSSRKHLDITEELRLGKTRTHFCTFAIRKKVLNDVGKFRPYFKTAEDIDFQLRLGEKTKVMYLSNIYYQYRLHNSSITHTQSEQKRVFYENIAREFQKQRKFSGTDDLELGKHPSAPYQSDDKPSRVIDQINGQIVGSAWKSYSETKYLLALKKILTLFKRAPFSVQNWKILIIMIIKILKSMLGINFRGRK